MSYSIAEEILFQIRHMDPRAILAWGAKNFIDTGCGLRFKTSGMVKWKGIVNIEYDEGHDLYNVEFAKIRKLEYTVVDRVEGVFVEDLVEIIDQQVG